LVVVVVVVVITQALRLNWFRVECQLSSLQSSLALSKVKDVVDRFNLVVQHTRYVDDLDELLDRVASLKQLWYWREPLFEVYIQIAVVFSVIGDVAYIDECCACVSIVL
jgi:hypothetical protein